MKVDHKTSLHDSGNVRVIRPREIVICLQYLFLYGTTAVWWAGVSLSRLRDSTQTHHTCQGSSGRVTSPSQRPIPENTQHSQEKSFLLRGSNPQSLQECDRKLMSQTARPRGSAICFQYRRKLLASTYLKFNICGSEHHALQQ